MASRQTDRSSYTASPYRLVNRPSTSCAMVCAFLLRFDILLRCQISFQHKVKPKKAGTLAPPILGNIPNGQASP